MNEQKIIEKIKKNYEPKIEEHSKFEQLKNLDKEVKTKPRIFAYTYGILGALVLGVGMCFAMKVIASLVPLGIVIGLLGIAMVSTTYIIYKKMLNNRKKKYSSEIIKLSDELLNKKEGE